MSLARMGLTFDEAGSYVAPRFSLDRYYDLANGTHEGVLVALWLTPDAAKALAVDGGEPADNLHITLCYCDGTIADALPVVREFAKSWSPLEGNTDGVSSFEPSESSDGMVPIYAVPVVDGLEPFRQYLAQELEKAGVKPKADHGDYVPHITLKYADLDEDPSVDLTGPVPLVFESVWVIQGDKEYEFPLEGGTMDLGRVDLRDAETEKPRVLTPAEVAAAHVRIPDWEVTDSGLTRQWTFDNRRVAAAVVAEIMAHANAVNHHPDLFLDKETVSVLWKTRASNGITQLDIDCAIATDKASINRESLSLRIPFRELLESIAARDYVRDDIGRFSETGGDGSSKPVDAAERDIAKGLGLPTEYHGKDSKEKFAGLAVDNPLPRAKISFAEATSIDVSKLSAVPRDMKIADLRSAQDYVQPSAVQHMKDGTYMSTTPLVMEIDGEEVLLNGNHSVIAKQLAGNTTVRVSHFGEYKRSINLRNDYVRDECGQFSSEGGEPCQRGGGGKSDADIKAAHVAAGMIHHSYRDGKFLYRKQDTDEVIARLREDAPYPKIEAVRDGYKGLWRIKDGDRYFGPGGWVHPDEKVKVRMVKGRYEVVVAKPSSNADDHTAVARKPVELDAKGTITWKTHDDGRVSVAGIDEDRWTDWAYESDNINEALAGADLTGKIDGNGGRLSAEQAADLLKTGEMIQAAAESHAVQGELWRGESYSSIADVEARYQRNATVTFDRLTAAATDADIAATYSGENKFGYEGHTPVVMRIQRNGGTLGIQTIPSVGGVFSGEVVMPKGESFRVSGVVKPGGTRYPPDVRDQMKIPHNAVIVELYNKTPAPKSVQRYNAWKPNDRTDLRDYERDACGQFGDAGAPCDRQGGQKTEADRKVVANDWSWPSESGKTTMAYSKLRNPETDEGKQMAEILSRYPVHSGVTFRGISLPASEFDKLTGGQYTFALHSSASKDLGVAEMFAESQAVDDRHAIIMELHGRGRDISADLPEDLADTKEVVIPAGTRYRFDFMSPLPYQTNGKTTYRMVMKEIK